MKTLGTRPVLGFLAVICCFVQLPEFANALRAKNSTHTGKSLAPQKLTGLLCRDNEVNGADLDVVLEEGGRRSLLFSKKVKGSDGKIIGREVAGMQSTVHCMDAGKEQKCLPADLDKPVPTCSEVGKSGRCPCVAVVDEPLKLSYQQAMVTEALELCQAKVRTKEPFRVLMFGLGGGAMPMTLRHRCESAHIESVENDEHVALIAQRLLGFKADDNNKVEIADGEEAATRRAKTNLWPHGPHYDLVLVDCFDGENNVAASCRSTNFVTAVHNLLVPGGQIVQNVMDVDLTRVVPMYHATFGDANTQKRVVQKGQILIVAKTPPTHPRAHVTA